MGMHSKGMHRKERSLFHGVVSDYELEDKYEPGKLQRVHSY
jgi:hypothetical protein